jgi:exopolysaccharide biosynthesis polyprenyl glycosylphosphotransferase
MAKSEALFLFVGDTVVFAVSLWLMLVVRYLDIPTRELFYQHLLPFGFLFVSWVIVFFIAGLYEKHTLVLQSRLPGVILNSQLINIVIAISFFYLIPFFNITPKTNLFIYLGISFALILAWRLLGQHILGFGRRQRALLVGSGGEMRELREEVNNNPRYGLTFVSSFDVDEIDDVDFQEEIVQRIYSEEIAVIVIDLQNEKVVPILPHLYNLIFSKVRFVDMHRVYEDIFDRVPLSLLRYSWFLENVSTAPKITYDTLKRFMDILVALVGGIISLVIYPFVAMAILFEDGAPIFIRQERIGKNNQIIGMYKFRSMKTNDGGRWVIEGDSRITHVGKFLRRSRIDELPQLWNVVRGDISLIGPRPDIKDLGLQLSKQIPYYTVRNIIKPGLSGWAQIRQDVPPQSVEETRLRLAYDLYYIKNRSFVLDVKIILKTIKILIMRAGK